MRSRGFVRLLHPSSAIHRGHHAFPPISRIMTIWSLKFAWSKNPKKATTNSRRTVYSSLIISRLCSLLSFMCFRGKVQHDNLMTAFYFSPPSPALSLSTKNPCNVPGNSNKTKQELNDASERQVARSHSLPLHSGCRSVYP